MVLRSTMSQTKNVWFLELLQQKQLPMKLVFINTLLIFCTSFIFVGCNNASLKKDIQLREYFKMLPDDVLPDFISKERCNIQLDSIDSYFEGWSELGPIIIYDELNGYMSLSETEYDWILLYRVLSNGRKMLLVNGNDEYGSHIRIFFDKGGCLIEDKEYRPYSGLTLTVTDLINFSILDDVETKEAKALFNSNSYYLYYHIPQNSDEIYVATRFFDKINPDNELIDKINFEAFKQCTLSWHDDLWFKELITYDSYCNEMHDYCIDYPNFLIPQGESSNRDGQRFISEDDESYMLVFFEYKIDGEGNILSFNEAFKAESEAIIDCKAELHDNYYILSYKDNDRAIKRLSVQSQDVFITLILEFGNLNKDYLEKVFAHVSESLNIIDTQYSTI